MSKWDVFFYGDVNIDLVIPGVDGFPLAGEEKITPVMETFIGGGAALTALGLGKLGMKPVFQGIIGDDAYGQFILGEFGKKGIDCSLLQVDKKLKTGISISFTNEHDRSFLTFRGTNEYLNVEEMSLEAVKESKHVHMTGYCGSKNHSQYLAVLKEINKQTNTTVSFDVGWDETGLWNKEIYQLLPYIDVLFMNETEALHYSREKTEEEAALSLKEVRGMVVLKLGKKGSMAMCQETIYTKPGFEVAAVDTTGAGDSFNAGFLYGYLNKESIQRCLTLGNGCGAMSVTQLGGNTGFPDRQGLRQLLEKQKR